ncbi:hypothetical protein CANCADRAFT_21604 [Tortispora caseinolytica NRRL Y-17796]|uniref:Sm domain-containing protein n=1 Tax=Tortispora caseinolytica NRRL Y-17796 TaxID=767744 RepID=A0A1E4TID2_9ASCO|nr:hypothetical protein CANCADRAFT_21604 [Tortispora caseinolytica NRRL Y-17796]
MSNIQPLGLIDSAIGAEVRVIMRNSREFVGTLIGFDDFVNIVLADATEYDDNQPKSKKNTVLINGNNICMLSL